MPVDDSKRQAFLEQASQNPAWQDWLNNQGQSVDLAAGTPAGPQSVNSDAGTSPYYLGPRPEPYQPQTLDPVFGKGAPLEDLVNIAAGVPAGMQGLSDVISQTPSNLVPGSISEMGKLIANPMGYRMPSENPQINPDGTQKMEAPASAQSQIEAPSAPSAAAPTAGVPSSFDNAAKLESAGAGGSYSTAVGGKTPNMEAASLGEGVGADLQRWLEDSGKALVAESQLAKQMSAENFKNDSDYIDNLRRVEGERQAFLRESHARSNDLETKILNTDIIAEHYWGSRSTGQRIMSSIGLMMSGYGAGISGQPNLAVEQLNRNIDRDIDAQKANLGKLVTLYSKHLERTKDEGEAFNQTKIDMLGIAKAESQRIADQFGGMTADVAFQQKLAALDQQKIKMIDNLANSKAKRAQELASAYHSRELISIGREKLGLSKAAARAENVVALPIYDANHKLLGMTAAESVTSQFSGPNGAEAKKKVEETIEGHMQTVEVVNQLKSFIKEHPYGAGLNLPARQKGLTMRNVFVTAFPGMVEKITRMPNKEDRKLLMDAISSPTDSWDVLTGKSLAAYDAILQYSKSQYESQLRSRGVIGQVQ